MSKLFLNYIKGMIYVNFIVDYHTDEGIRKKINQDALMIKIAKVKEGRCGLFVVCDGMGGLSMGELASATTIKSLSTWFNEELKTLIYYSDNEGIVQNLEEHIKDINEKIIEYGEERKVTLGTTLTALLTINEDYYIIHVGDSRVYKINDNIERLTADQTLVAREIERGNITEEEAKNHPKRNVLLQCVGATTGVKPIIYKGRLERESVYVLCSDGFHHELLECEIYQGLNSQVIKDSNDIKSNLKTLIDLAKSRKERDNITAIAIKVVD